MFEWDETKREANLAKHHLDFRDARLLFDGRPAVLVPAMRRSEQRFVTIAAIEGRLYTVVWTWRNRNRRLISFRRSRYAEEEAYRQLLR
jgi:uncharacterized DUF497 family protein